MKATVAHSRPFFSRFDISETAVARLSEIVHDLDLKDGKFA